VLQKNLYPEAFRRSPWICERGEDDIFKAAGGFIGMGGKVKEKIRKRNSCGKRNE